MRPLKNILIPLSILATTTLYADDGFEPNNSLYQAKAISDGYYDLFCGDDDWFYLDLTLGTVTIIMTPTDPSIDLNMELYNSNGDIVSANYQPSQEQIYYDIPTAGRYYIRVHPTAAGRYSSYTLDISSDTVDYTEDNYEPNNSMNEAKKLSDGHYNLFAGDSDWFYLNLSTGKLTVTMTPSNPSVDLNI